MALVNDEGEVRSEAGAQDGDGIKISDVSLDVAVCCGSPSKEFFRVGGADTVVEIDGPQIGMLFGAFSSGGNCRMRRTLAKPLDPMDTSVVVVDDDDTESLLCCC